jgi:HlyD family secretion protein
MKKHLLFVLLGVAVMPAAALSTVERGAESAGPGAKTGSAPPRAVAFIAGPGRVEPESEDIRLGSELGGKLRQVSADEGDTVRSGQVLAVLENDDYLAAVRLAEADVRMKEAALRKLMNGARLEERETARALVDEASAVLENARAELARSQHLSESGTISSAEFERAERAERVAEAQYRQAVERRALVDARPREEDRAMAEAELELARARVAEAQARYDKTLIRSPIDGTVLRRHHRSGESISNSSTLPDPVFTVGNERTLRVRVEIDESDIGRVTLGERAYVSADAYAGRKFWGKVIRISQQLGRKNIRTDEPTERVDNKVLEVLVELEGGTVLPAGLRVDAYLVGTGD